MSTNYLIIWRYTEFFCAASTKRLLIFCATIPYSLFISMLLYLNCVIRFRPASETREVFIIKRGNAAPTMKDVAREAGVSLGTVSKVINGVNVGESYRLRVEEAAKKLGYRVNNYARGLKTSRTNTAAILMPSLMHPFYAALTDELIASFMRRGFRPILMITNYDIEAEQKCVSLVKQNMVDGIVGLTYNPGLEVDDGLPYVSIDRHVKGIPCVSSDNFGGGQLAAEKLLELGCRKLLFLRIGPDVYGEADKRVAGFEDVCRKRQIEHDSILLNDRETEAPFFDYLRAHIHGGEPDFDGIFCNTDGLACHVRDFLAEEGVEVPGQVQIIGFDGIINFTTGRYYCSTIVQPVRLMAETAVELLLERDVSAASSIISLPIQYVPCGTTKDSVN